MVFKTLLKWCFIKKSVYLQIISIDIKPIKLWKVIKNSQLSCIRKYIQGNSM